MKILFFSRLYHPHLGGIEKHLEKISDQLIKKGHEIIVLTTRYEENLEDESNHNGVKIVRFDQPKVKFLGLIYTWFWLLKNSAMIKNSDVLHIHDVFIWYWPIKLLFPQKKVFVTIHGRWGVYPIPLIDKLQKKIAAEFSDGVIAIGEYITKNYQIEADIVSYGATDVPGEHYQKNENSIVYVGRMDKDIALSKAFVFLNKLKEFDIDFCGDGELKPTAKNYGTVHGFTDPDPFYKKAMYCFASGYLTILEALAHKCLVFTIYDHPLQEDYYKLTPFRDFVITSDNPEEIYQRFRYFQTHQADREKIIEKGSEWVKDQTWERMTENYLKLWS